MFKHILVPTDGSELSLKAAQVAGEMAATHHARITAMHVVPPYEAPLSADVSFYPAPYTRAEYTRAARSESSRMLAEVEKVAGNGTVACDTLTVEGDQPWQAIVEAARSTDCDLIVMGSHGRRGLEGLLLGSETAKVLTHSTTPVLVCRSHCAMHGIQVTFRNIPHSVGLGDRVRELAEKLDRLHPRILNSNVVLEAVRHPRRPPTFAATVRVRIPEGEILATEVHSEEIRLALRNAFVAVRRDLSELSREAESAEREAFTLR